MKRGKARRYSVPAVDRVDRVREREALLIASGDARESANALCWPAQRALEAQLARAFSECGWRLRRVGPTRPHGFVTSQAHGREVFAAINPEAHVVVAEAVWQYSSNVLIGLARHRGPILVGANWSGQWPGLVGALNLRGSLTKAGVAHSFVWDDRLDSARAVRAVSKWTKNGHVNHDVSHADRLDPHRLPAEERRLGEALAERLRRRPAILGVFDEGCMGMFNAIIPDNAMNAAGMFKERLSQSQLLHAMCGVSERDRHAVRRWLQGKGMRFVTGSDEATELTDAQIDEQCAMYVAAARMADVNGCDAIGIQYQLGLAGVCASSDLAEGLLNCSDRPPVRALEGPREGAIIRAGRPITHFNEADEGSGMDAVITTRVWTAMGLEPDTTLHDLRWGDWVEGDIGGPAAELSGGRTFVWVLEISGAVPPSHLDGGYAGALSERQPPMYFTKGGGGIKGTSRAGEVVWSRIYVEQDSRGRDRLRMDLGRCRAVKLSRAECQRRWKATTPCWPMMNAVLYGVTRDQMMAKHQSNHIQVAYAPDASTADRALAAKAAMTESLGIRVNLCGTDRQGRPLSDRLASMS